MSSGSRFQASILEHGVIVATDKSARYLTGRLPVQLPLGFNAMADAIDEEEPHTLPHTVMSRMLRTQWP